MLQRLAFHLPYPTLALLALALGTLGVILLSRRRGRGRGPALLVGLAALLLALAAGGFRISVPTLRSVPVLLDLSPSTRGAAYRDPARLEQRLRELLGNTPYSIVRSETQEQLQSQISNFKSPISDSGSPILPPLLLFSDGQFPLPASTPPIYAIVDPELDKPTDARVLSVRHARGRTLAILQNDSATLRPLANATLLIPPGRSQLDLGPSDRPHRLQLARGDLWPENDALTSLPDQPALLSRWSVGIDLPGLTPMASNALPAAPAGYSFTGLLALDAGQAASLSLAQQQAIATFVRDLGGSLLLVGQDARWSDLRGTPLASLSPLAVDPPEPSREWVLLLDASGSMAQPDPAGDKWHLALRAAQSLVASLPPEDPVHLGSFAQTPRWWRTEKAGELAAQGLQPPIDLRPRGPTNLMAALDAVLSSPAAAPRDVLLLTDAEVRLDAAALAPRFSAANLRFSCLILSPGSGRAALQTLAAATAGQVIEEPNPTRWPVASRALAQATAPSRWQPRPMTLATPATVTAPAFNLAWSRPSTTLLAQGTTGEPLAARWNLGLGQVASVCFPASTQLLQHFAEPLLSEPASDLIIAWPEIPSEPLQVATPRPASFSLQWIPEAAEEPTALLPLTLAAPHRYETTLPATTGGALAILQAEGQPVARRAFPPRYSSEFEHLGTNRAHLQKLCANSGGRLVEPADPTPLELPFPRNYHDLSSLCGGLALLPLAALVLLLRRST